MGTVKQNIDDAMLELERLSDEIQVKLKLASMDARDTWNDKLEPKLLEARQHAKEAKDASKHAIDDAMTALKEFAKSLP